MSKTKRFGWIVILIITLYSAKVNFEYLHQIKETPSDDPSNLQVQLDVIDRVYLEAKGEGFRVYNYLPSVYDFSYQYLYWWYGTRKFGYQPKDLAYLPDQPEYIKNNTIYWKKQKDLNDDSFTFLVIQKDLERPDREDLWRGNFNQYCQKEIISSQNKIEIIKLTSKCPNTISSSAR